MIKLDLDKALGTPYKLLALKIIDMINEIVKTTEDGYRYFNVTPFKVKVAINGNHELSRNEIIHLIDNLKAFSLVAGEEEHYTILLEYCEKQAKKIK